MQQTHHQDVSAALADAYSNGFSRIDLHNIQLEAILARLKQDVGRLTITLLNVLPRTKAKPKSLSIKYGDGGFPFHTDFAFRPRPPRFLLLVNEGPFFYSRQTALARIRDLPTTLRFSLGRSSWRLKTKSDDYVVSALIQTKKHEMWRVDFDFLVPEDEHAVLCKSALPSALETVKFSFSWQPKSALLIDNWQCAHARESLRADEVDEGVRKLTRFEVWQDARMDH
jgi:hypothetical protein